MLGAEKTTSGRRNSMCKSVFEDSKFKSRWLQTIEFEWCEVSWRRRDHSFDSWLLMTLLGVGDRGTR